VINPTAASANAVLPAQALGEGHAFGRGGRCEGPCSDLVKNKNKNK
jgi:hypothetical protein